MEEIQFEFVDNGLKAEDFVRLKVTTGFSGSSLEQVEEALRNSLFTVAAVCDGRVVGMGRLVGDGAMYWYLQEITVLPEYQGKGIGTGIVNRLIEYIRNAAIPNTVVDVGLTAKGKERFYEKFGFTLRSTGMGKMMEK